MVELHCVDSLKMLRETLCVAQTRIGNSTELRAGEHLGRLGRLLDDIDRQRPLGADGKHGNLHTRTCGCEVG
jgi:hypothetical protein